MRAILFGALCAFAAIAAASARPSDAVDDLRSLVRIRTICDGDTAYRAGVVFDHDAGTQTFRIFKEPSPATHVGAFAEPTLVSEFVVGMKECNVMFDHDFVYSVSTVVRGFVTSGRLAALGHNECGACLLLTVFNEDGDGLSQQIIPLGEVLANWLPLPMYAENPDVMLLNSTWIIPVLETPVDSSRMTCDSACAVLLFNKRFNSLLRIELDGTGRLRDTTTVDIGCLQAKRMRALVALPGGDHLAAILKDGALVQYDLKTGSSRNVGVRLFAGVSDLYPDVFFEGQTYRAEFGHTAVQFEADGSLTIQATSCKEASR